MALGDGTTWDETVPTDASNAVDIDEYNRDVRKGVRLRMANEHEWVSSDSTTSASGMHKFMTLQEQGAKPTLAGTQQAALYVKTDLGFYFENSAGTEVMIVNGTNIGTTGSSIVCATMTAGNVTITGTLAVTGGLIGSLFGAWSSKSNATDYEATSDGLVMASDTADGATSNVIGYTDTSTAPTTLRIKQKNNTFESNNSNSITMPVRKGDYWSVTGATVVYWLSIGA